MVDIPLSASEEITRRVEGTDTIYDTTIVYLPPDTLIQWVGQSALRITEVAPLNVDFLDEEGNDPAWVELYNTSNEDVDLQGFALIENLPKRLEEQKNIRKFVFGSDIIKAKSFKVVFCDGKNISAVKSEDKDGRHTRPHADWKLDKKGGTIYLLDKFNGIRDQVEYPELTAGLSWGIVDGGYWQYFNKPTPEKPNTAATAYEEIVPPADMGGIKCVLLMAEKIDGFDYDKFFRAYARMWQRMDTLQMCEWLATSDSHPLSYQRINVTLQQFDEFLDTYGIKEGDGMYLAPEDRVLIW